MTPRLVFLLEFFNPFVGAVKGPLLLYYKRHSPHPESHCSLPSTCAAYMYKRGTGRARDNERFETEQEARACAERLWARDFFAVVCGTCEVKAGQCWEVDLDDEITKVLDPNHRREASVADPNAEARSSFKKKVCIDDGALGERAFRWCSLLALRGEGR